jgi:hypothetical protein
LLLLGFCAAVGFAQDTGRTVVIDGQTYVQGELFLESPADTLALVARGFRNFVFLGRSVRTVKYQALCPRTVNARELPPQVTGLSVEPADDSIELLEKLTPEERGTLLEALEMRRAQSSAVNRVLITLPGRCSGALEISTRSLEAELWRLNHQGSKAGAGIPVRVPEQHLDARPMMTYAFYHASQRGILATMIHCPSVSPGSGYNGGYGSPATSIRSRRQEPRYTVRRNTPARSSSTGLQAENKPLYISGPAHYTGIGPSRSQGIQGPPRRR